MAININTNFTPFRLRLSRREPVQLTVDLTNNGNTAMVSMNVALTPQLSFSKGGFKNRETARIPEFNSSETRRFYFEIWPKASTRLEEQPIVITVFEHYKSFDYIKNKTEKKLSLQVEE